MTQLQPKTVLTIRPAKERFHSQRDWLDSYHSFSFSNHYDPAWTGFGPLLVINDDTIAAGKGFGMHPHRDMEIVTVMVDGQINHRDSMGHAEVLRAGEVQRMSAGTGIVHSEMNLGDQPCRPLQIWIQPQHMGITPSYEQRHFQIERGWTPLLAPDPSEATMAIDRPVRLWRAQPQPGDSLTLPENFGEHGWLQLIDGAVEVSGTDGAPQRLERGDGLGWQGATNLTLSSESTAADLLLFSLA